MSERIQYFSTNKISPAVSFPEALLKGLAPDKGLYLPDSYPALTADELTGMGDMNYAGIATLVLGRFLQDSISQEELRLLCHDAYNFDVPLQPVDERKYIMRLDQGPTASFKDFAARMMARLMNNFLTRSRQHLLILTATSGDTGSAVANAFYGLDHIDVVVLYPQSEVTEVQRRQMTTLRKNIHVIALDGKFDDCQNLVKQAFVDPELQHLPLSSANSINIGRLLPQSVFYFYAWSRLRNYPEERIVFAVPSGNFGNLMGGLIAKQMGLPVERFVIGTNENKEVPDYLTNGTYKLIIPSIACISSAMNVGHPSNMARIIALYGGVMNEQGDILTEPDFAGMQKDLWATSVTDEETIQTMKDCWQKNQTLLEPHGSVAWTALERYLEKNPGMELPAVALETAHPAKFPEEINRVLGFNPALPPSLAGLEGKQEEIYRLANNYAEFKRYLNTTFP
ncbi:MAG: threonine synthase [Bacteroidales bacterium]